MLEAYIILAATSLDLPLARQSPTAAEQRHRPPPRRASADSRGSRPARRARRSTAPSSMPRCCSTAGFSPGVIDGKRACRSRRRVQGFQESRGLPVTGELDKPTRAGAAAGQRARRRVNVAARRPTTSQRRYRLSRSRRSRRTQAKLEMPRLPQHAREGGRAVPHDARRRSRAERPDALIGARARCCACPTSSRPSRDYGGSSSTSSGVGSLNASTSTASSRRATMSSSTSREGVLKVLGRGATSCVAQFPVTMGSSAGPAAARQLEGDDLRLHAAVPLPARPVLGRRRRRGRAGLAAGAERAGRGRLARPHQGALRHPRHRASRRRSAAPKATAASA